LAVGDRSLFKTGAAGSQPQKNPGSIDRREKGTREQAGSHSKSGRMATFDVSHAHRKKRCFFHAKYNENF
jgi:hypothetical protein